MFKIFGKLRGRKNIDGLTINCPTTSMLRSKIIVNKGSGNEINIGDDSTVKGAIRIQGSGNKLEIGRSAVVAKNIVIHGSRNKITLGDNVKLSGRITIKGSDQYIIIDEGTLVCDASILCQENQYVRIGRNCLISDRVDIRTTDSYTLIDRETGNRVNLPAPVEIGDHVWIGLDAVVNKGAIVADDNIIEAKSFVSQRFPEMGTVIAGAPARVVKRGVTWQRDRKARYNLHEIAIQSDRVATPSFDAFLHNHRTELALESTGQLQRTSDAATFPASSRILASLGIAPSDNLPAYEQLSLWLLSADDATRKNADLALPIPPESTHFIPGQYNIFYDFKNTDIVLSELEEAGVNIRGSFLDFGCSSGRNLAVLRRAFGDELELYGADPAGASIAWLKQNIAGVDAVVSHQEPPLPFDDKKFDIIIAKSIWTHFSPSAGRRWFAEMARIMKPGGHFLFSVHGPHDIASRIINDIPRPKYERYAGHDHWTRDAFLADLVEKYDRDGFYFQPFKRVGYQADLKLIDGATTNDWGLTFISPDYLRSMLPADLAVVKRSIARTGNRHDVYIVRRN